MAIELHQVVEINAPVEQVWTFIMTPEHLVDCMPGASLTGKKSETEFEGSLKLKVGAISASYAGSVTYQDVGADNHSCILDAKGQDTSGGTAGGTIRVQLEALDEGGTRAEVNSSIQVTGRLMQVGRGMIDGVSKQVINRFVSNVKARLAEQGEAAAEGGEPASHARASDEESLNVLALIWASVRDGIKGLFRKLFK